MPRLQVYLPDALYRAVNEHGLPASELLQKAVQAELRRRQLNDEADAYVAELIGEVGQPPSDDVARAEALALRIHERATTTRAG